MNYEILWDSLWEFAFTSLRYIVTRVENLGKFFYSRGYEIKLPSGVPSKITSVPRKEPFLPIFAILYYN